jgi:hypothetical protein
VHISRYVAANTKSSAVHILQNTSCCTHPAEHILQNTSLILLVKHYLLFIIYLHEFYFVRLRYAYLHRYKILSTRTSFLTTHVKIAKLYKHFSCLGQSWLNWYFSSLDYDNFYSLTRFWVIIVTTHHIKDLKMQSLTFSVQNIMKVKSRLQSHTNNCDVFWRKQNLWFYCYFSSYIVEYKIWAQLMLQISKKSQVVCPLSGLNREERKKEPVW